MKQFLCILYFSIVSCFCSQASAINQTSNDSLNQVIISEIKIIGNKITKDYVIIREFAFKKGDTLSAAALEVAMAKTRQNLLNTSLFNFVTVNAASVDGKHSEVYIMVTERWYIWPAPIFEIPDRNLNIWWQQRDFTRVNYGAYLIWNNFRGRRETLQFIARLGYSEKYGLAYDIPNLGKKQRGGLTFSYGYSRNHEIGYKSSDNILLFFKDPDKYIRKESIAKIRYNFRPIIYNSHHVELKFNDIVIGDTITKMAPGYLQANLTEARFFTLYYAWLSDHRDNKAYPLKGYLFSAEFTQNGLGILKNENLGFAKTDIGFRHYTQLSQKWYFAASAKVKLSSTYHQPYYLQRGLGYTDYTRGYEYFVFDGQQYVQFKSNFKYKLISPKTVDMGLFTSDKFDKFHFAFYLNAFFDAGRVSDRLYLAENPLSDQWLYGYGLGLDWVTYYDMVFRFEFALNRWNKPGFYIHYEAPI